MLWEAEEKGSTTNGENKLRSQIAGRQAKTKHYEKKSHMNVIGINGSPRNQWNTATLVARALEGAAALGAATHLYDPGSLPQRGRVWEGEVLCTAAMAVPSQGLFVRDGSYFAWPPRRH